MANTQRFVPVEADDTTAPAPALNSTGGAGRFVPVGPDDSPAVQEDDEKPGYFQRLGEGLGLPTRREELEQAAPHIPHSWGEAASTAADLLAPGVSQAARMLYHEGKKDYEGIKDVAKESEEAGANIAEGGPVGANFGKIGSAVLKAGVRAVPIIGEPTETAGEDVHDKNYRGAAGDLTAAILPLVTDYIKDNPELITTPVRGAKAGIEKMKPYATPKNVGRAGGGFIGGKLGTIAVPGYGTVGGAMEGAALGGKAVESLIGKERANKPFFKPTAPPGLPKATVPSAEPLINEGESEPEGFDSQPIPERGPEAPAKRTEDRLPRVPTEIGSPGGPTSILEKVRAVKPVELSLRGEEALPIPQRIASEAPTLHPTRERALRHTLGDYSLDALGQTKEGISAAQQLSNGTYQNYADLANYEGVLKPKSLAEKTGKEWTTDDFKRSKAQHGKELNPNKELVLRHLVDNYDPADIARRTEGWGRSVVTSEARP
jgi:hypothetical protein